MFTLFRIHSIANAFHRMVHRCTQLSRRDILRGQYTDVDNVLPSQHHPERYECALTFIPNRVLCRPRLLHTDVLGDSIESSGERQQNQSYTGY